MDSYNDGSWEEVSAALTDLVSAIRKAVITSYRELPIEMRIAIALWVTAIVKLCCEHFRQSVSGLIPW
jgi:hypothetical protein